MPFSIHYLVATATVEFSFCFDTLGLHHLIQGENGKTQVFSNELIYGTEADSQIQRTDLWLPRGVGRAELGVWS